MSNNWFQDVIEFCIEVRHDDIGKFPSIPPFHYQHLTRKLIKEETHEVLHALAINNLAAIADGIADSIVVLLGAAVYYGIDIRPIWDIVHTSNMAKVGGKFNPDGKLLKPEGWVGPNIADELVRQQNSRDTTIIPISKQEKISQSQNLRPPIV